MKVGRASSVHGEGDKRDASGAGKARAFGQFEGVARPPPSNLLDLMAGSTGLEPAASGLTGQCANQAAPRPRRFHDSYLAHVGQAPYARWSLRPVICTHRYVALPSAEMTYGEDARVRVPNGPRLWRASGSRLSSPEGL